MELDLKQSLARVSKSAPSNAFLRGAIGLAIALLLPCCLVTGCGDKDAGAETEVATPEVPPEPIDMTPLRTAFAEGDASLKLFAEEGIGLVRARAWSDAAEHFQKLSRNPGLSAEQKQAVQDTISKIQLAAAGRPR